MQTLYVVKKLEAYPTFTVNTVAHIIKKDIPYTKVFLNRLKKRGVISHLQRNVYTVHDDPLIIASRIVWPSYISLWAAFRYHNLTEQIPHTISVVTTRCKNRKTIVVAQTTIRFEHLRPAWFFGFEKTTLKDVEIFIAEPEKALIDAVLLKKISTTEIYMLLKENINQLSSEKIIQYILQTKNKALMKRFGWMLESLHCNQAVRLQKFSYKTLLPLDYSRPRKGKKDTTWGLLVNIGGVDATKI